VGSATRHGKAREAMTTLTLKAHQHITSNSTSKHTSNSTSKHTSNSTSKHTSNSTSKHTSKQTLKQSSSKHNSKIVSKQKHEINIYVSPFLSRLMESKNKTAVSADEPGRRAA
jgi:hypothetical protein